MFPRAAFWRGKRVLVSGHTGFKGAWLSIWLQRLGAQVTGVALSPAAQPNLFEAACVSERVDSHYGDVRDADALARLMRQCRPEIVLHLAAQALVRRSYAQPLETFSTNVMGTANMLEAIRSLPGVRVAIVVTSDKVYRNCERPHPYREDDALGGHDPYSASKAAAELVVSSYRDSFFAQAGVALASARAGNVIGGGDWSEDRLLPDAFRAWSQESVLEIRRPDAVRPWQHVLEPLSAYLLLAEKLWGDATLAGAFNFGPDPAEAVTVRGIVQFARNAFGRGESAFAAHDAGPHEAGMLMVDSAKARTQLGVFPRWPVLQAVERSMDWYRRFSEGAAARELCLADISDYETQGTALVPGAVAAEVLV